MKYFRIFLVILILFLIFNHSVITEAAGSPTIETFKTSYQIMRVHFPMNKDIQLFGGGLVLSEFNDDTENIYAGHLGGFWAPPFYSSPNGGQAKASNDWRKGFNAGLVFYNYGYNAGATELPSNPATEAFWYPSKMVMTKNYPGGGGGTDIKSVKVALPGVRGFGLKMTVTNKSPTPQSLGVLLLESLPTFESLKQWNSQSETGWNWMQSASVRNLTNSYYDSGENMVVIEDPANSAYMAAGLSETPDSWGLDENYSGNNYNYLLYNQFRNQGGHLSNSDSDNDGNGTTFGLVSQAPSLAQNQSHTFSLVIGMGSTKDEAMNIVRAYRNKDIETEADNYWNQRLSTLFSNLPIFQSADGTLNRIYQNAALTYLINKWPIFNNFESELAGFSQAASFYPWMLGTAGYFPLADASSWKEQLKKMLAMDFTNCRAFDPVSGINLCDHGYAYNKVSIVDGIYRYVTSTSDFGFLDETVAGQSVLARISDLINQDDKLEYGSDHLANYGPDNALYEYDIHCDLPQNVPLKGKYTGLVVSPNAERVIAHREVGDLAEKKGNSSLANSHHTKAEQIKTGLQTLWNPTVGWFDSVSLYDPQNNLRSAPLKNTFWGMYPLLLLQYDNLLTDGQKTGLLNNIGQFIGNYGFTSVSTNLRTNWCGRTDWHGPGLYSGAAGAVLTGLFKSGQEGLAYDLLSPADGKGYAYLARMPYFSQAFPSDSQSVGLLPGYMEGLSLGQSLIEGMFGVFPNTKQTKIAPHIPARLLQNGPVSLKGMKAQGHIWDITVNDMQNQTLNLAVNGVSNGTNTDHFRFEYEMKGTLIANISRLLPNESFIITASSLSGGENVVVKGTSNVKGTLIFNLPLDGYYLISGSIFNVSTVTALTVNDRAADITGQSQLSLDLIPNTATPGYIDIPVVVNYSSGSPRYLVIRLNYNMPPTLTPTPTPTLSPTATPSSSAITNTPTPTPANKISGATINGEDLNLRGQPFTETSLTYQGGPIDVPVVIQYASGETRGIVIRFIYQAPLTPTPTSALAPTSTPTLTPTSTPTLTPTPTPTPNLPVTELNYPIGYQRYGVAGYADTCINIRGWTCDLDAKDTPLQVDIWDIKSSGNIFLGMVIANMYPEQAVAAACRNSTVNHGYTFSLPDSIKDGQNHTIEAHAININSVGQRIDSRGHPVLSGGPSIINCNR